MTMDEARAELLREARELVESWDHRGSWSADSPVGMVARLADEVERLASQQPAPTEDERDAAARSLHRAVYKHLRFQDLTAEERDDTYRRADAILAAGFRLHGPVTDEMDVDALSAFYGEERDGWSMGKVRRMRAALEAAESARVPNGGAE